MVARARPGAGGGLDVLERLTAWHGIGAQAASDLLEEPAGDLWLATNRGAAYVPASVRFGQPPLPPVALVEGRVDDRPIRLDEPLVLPHDRNRIELRFAALAYRHRAGLRHQVRLSPDEPWSESTGEPAFRWVDLSPGTYHAEYRVSRDGRAWSAVPAGFSFRVEPPWYATLWFLLLVGLVAAASAAALYRARVGHLLGLERQRTRIAMDLHDQVGSGLASVGILCGVMAAEDLEPPERRRTAREIAGVAEELGHSLSDIVWALDPQTASLEELATRLAEHGERLFPDEDVIFEARLPARWPPVTSSVAVRRGVLLIGLEALHNAARHAGARRVTLAITPRERLAWELSVHDDGTGIPSHRDPQPPSGNGRGLTGMDRRARTIGGRLDIDTGPGRGTTVTLRFRPGEGRITASARALTRMIMRRRSGA
jgi:signal transduction histidine kinase